MKLKRKDPPDGMRFRWACEHSDGWGLEKAGDRTDGYRQLDCDVIIAIPEQVAAHALALLIAGLTATDLPRNSWEWASQ